MATELDRTPGRPRGAPRRRGTLRRDGSRDSASIALVVAKSVALFIAAAIAEIGGAYLVWQGVREGKGGWLAVLGGLALAGYGFIATLQPDHNFGRVLAAYGGVFVAGSLLWGYAFDGFRPDRYDLIGAGICLVGVVVIMYARG